MVVPESALFVHFIPPPLRARDKPDLAWIVLTCNGSGCREARHVNFMSVTGFSTYEGQPPEVSPALVPCSLWLPSPQHNRPSSLTRRARAPQK